MKLATLFGTLTAAVAVTFESLSVVDQATVQQKLAKWKTLYCHLAEAQGYTPPTQESVHLEHHTNVDLERFHATIVEVEEASRDNPHATFSEFNQFALMTNGEFTELVEALFGNRTVSESSDTGVSAGRVEGSVDWSTSKCMPPVKHQGGCGSCWAFSSVGAAEVAHCLATGELIDVAEQELVSCSRRNHGCGGGYPEMALEGIQTQGVCIEDAYPYTSGTTKESGACRSTCEKKKLAIGEPVTARGEAAILSALVNQPVVVAVEAGNIVWKNYKSGVVTRCPGGRSDHAVLAVGFGTDDNNSDFIKIKNSWGPLWGENGYIRLQRGAPDRGMCNVNQEVAYPKLSGAPQPSSRSPAPSTKTPSPADPPTQRPTTTVPQTSPVVAPTSAPSTSTATRTPKPSRRTHKPKKTTVAPSSTQIPPTPSPSPSVCGSCKGCYFADVKWCVQMSFAKADCEATDGALWCGEN